MELHIWRAIFKLPSSWLALVLQATQRMQVEEVQLGLAHQFWGSLCLSLLLLGDFRGSFYLSTETFLEFAVAIPALSTPGV